MRRSSTPPSCGTRSGTPDAPAAWLMVYMSRVVHSISLMLTISCDESTPNWMCLMRFGASCTLERGKGVSDVMLDCAVGKHAHEVLHRGVRGRVGRSALHGMRGRGRLASDGSPESAAPAGVCGG
jgi:hypothetical protein